MGRLAVIIIGALAASGCKTTEYVDRVVVKTVRVEVRAVCPEEEEYQRLKATRPTPLRHQEMPETATERTAKAAAQLGKYEAEGGWADQVESALDRCQEQ